MLSLRGGVHGLGEYGAVDSTAIDALVSGHIAPTKRLFELVDRDNDGTLSTAEVQAAAAELQKRREALAALPLVKTTFEYVLPEDRGSHDNTVLLVGDWSDWLETHELHPGEDGTTYAVDVPVPQGRVHFKFVVNEVWTPSALYGIADDGCGTSGNNFMDISGEQSTQQTVATKPKEEAEGRDKKQAPQVCAQETPDAQPDGSIQKPQVVCAAEGTEPQKSLRRQAAEEALRRKEAQMKKVSSTPDQMTPARSPTRSPTRSPPRTPHRSKKAAAAEAARQGYFPARRAAEKVRLPATDTLDPRPYTLHPTPYNLHPTPYTLH